MISEVTLAIVARLGLATLANVIHPYPTQADALRRVAFQYSVTPGHAPGEAAARGLAEAHRMRDKTQ